MRHPLDEGGFSRARAGVAYAALRPRLQGRPSIGSWLSYGLGSENSQPAGFRRGQRRHDPARRVGEFTAARFLPARHQGSMFDAFSGGEPIGNVTPAEARDAPAREARFRRRRPTARFSARSAATSPRSRPRSATTKPRSRCSRPCPELTDLRGETRGHAAALRLRFARQTQGAICAAVSARAPAGRARRALRGSQVRARHPQRRAVGSARRPREEARAKCVRRRSADRRAAHAI